MACSSCFSGGITPLTPTGTETTIHGLPTYVATPGEGVQPKGLIVVITDAFGWEFVNNRVLCDRYAKQGGWLVYCPDFMNGMFASHLTSICYSLLQDYFCPLILYIYPIPLRKQCTYLDSTQAKQCPPPQSR